MRSLLLLLFSSTLSILSVTGLDTNTAKCLLTRLDFDNGLVLIGDGFTSEQFDYQCSCAKWLDGPFYTGVHTRAKSNDVSTEIYLNGAGINVRSQNTAISNFGGNSVPFSPWQDSDRLTFKDGQNTIQIIVGTGEPCQLVYTVSCYKPPSSSIIGDPQFVGLRGQSYQVHGVSGEIYNIVSDQEFQYNSRFVFLSTGKCPVVNGIRQRGCFSHPGSYLGEIGIKTRSGEKIHLVSGSGDIGFQSIEVNGREMAIGETILLEGDLGSSITRNTTHIVDIDLGNWSFIFENSDKYVNQRVRVGDARRLRSHGLLGQTWRETTYPNPIKYIQGDVDDYVIRENDIFGDSFVYNAFN